MDLVGGLSAAQMAINLVKDLRSIDRSVDDATFKLKIAEVIEALAETKIALSEAKETIAAKDSEIRNLKEKLSNATSGEACPVCQTGRLKTTNVRRHPQMGDVGLQEKDLKCDNQECGHHETRMHDPNGLLNR